MDATMVDLASDTVTYRRLWRTDAQALREHFLRLPPTHRHSRFAMGVSDDFVATYAKRSFSLENVLFGFFVDGVLRGVGELRPLNARLMGVGGEMEGAFTVEPGWQNKGVASELMRHVIRAAQVRCCTSLYLSFLSENRAMRRLALRFGARIEVDHSDSEARIATGVATPDVWLQETVGQATSFVIAALDLQQARLRRAAG